MPMRKTPAARAVTPGGKSGRTDGGIRWFTTWAWSLQFESVVGHRDGYGRIGPSAGVECRLDRGKQ